MEKKFKEMVSNAGKNTKDLLVKSKNIAVQAVDQNDDGKFDLDDVSSMATSLGNVVKKGAKSLKETVDEKAREKELKTLQPIFLEDLGECSMPKFIRIVERGKKHIESNGCKDAIGFWSDYKEMRWLNIFRDSVDSYMLSFYPDCQSEFYYVDPIDKDHYIGLDEYFSYLKQVRIGELQKIAQDLGATHFRVIYKEEKTTFSKRSVDRTVGMKTVASITASQEMETDKYAKIEVAADMECLGHEPVKPDLKYMKNNPTILSLIRLRLNEQGPLKHQSLTIKLSDSSGLKGNEAAKIDTILKGLKCSGNATVVSEAQNESRRYLEYEIDF